MADAPGKSAAYTFYNAPPRACLVRNAINAHYLEDETVNVTRLLAVVKQTSHDLQHVFNQASTLVKNIRVNEQARRGLDAFLLEYDLSTKEGIVLMCIAEALLRIPDSATVDKLIHDKLLEGDWLQHLEHSDSLLVNASTWGLMLTGKLVSVDQEASNITSWLKRMVAKSGEPVIRAAMRQAMGILGQQFVMGESIEAALKRSHSREDAHLRHSYDMLGEAAMTSEDAQRYFQSYLHAISQIGDNSADENNLYAKPSISIKLSALHPRYQLAQRERVMSELHEKLLALALAAQKHAISLTIDAEESERLELSLDLFEAVFCNPQLAHWSGFGLAVQAYQKRAYAVIEWLIHLAKTHNKRIPIRLVKGAYWDSEIKRSQELGLPGYPVYTRKHHTDLSYQACALKLIENADVIFPQFATHNAYTITFILTHTTDKVTFEFQRLHGMGDALYHETFSHYENRTLSCRVYAPVGGHKELLPYLVRRLLENGANSSFVNRIHDKATPIETIVCDPIGKTEQHHAKPHPRIALPMNLYGDNRRNSSGLNLYDETNLIALTKHLMAFSKQTWLAQPIVDGVALITNPEPVISPFDQQRVIGYVHHANAQHVEEALRAANKAFEKWNHTDVRTRCAALRNAADLLEAHFFDLLGLLINEAGKTIADAIAEVREAIDFCRYYAQQGEELLSCPQTLNGPTGESNQLFLVGRGAFVCISPWNFPLAIFLGQVTAALAAGNTVIAKPAGQTPLVAAFAVKLLHKAGIPVGALHLLPGAGGKIGPLLFNDQRVKGIVFTGSTETARVINQGIAQRPGAIIPFIAETGGQNAMLVDSSALPEQVVSDVINSAFNSAGQRCSALRVLFLQEDIAERIVQMLKGAMRELRVGDPRLFSTDIGPTIDAKAKQDLEQHIQHMQQHAHCICSQAVDNKLATSAFVSPCVFEISDISELKREVFGPILHVIRYRESELDRVIASINQTGYGLTLGIHSRIDSTINKITSEARVGNIYINRNMIGAVVGVQPFGGEGLSGTGPKAGGPHYLYRFCSERTVTTNTTAAGGNTSLLVLDNND